MNAIRLISSPDRENSGSMRDSLFSSCHNFVLNFLNILPISEEFLIRSDIGRVATTRTIPTDNLCSRLKTNWLAVLAIEDLLSFFILSTSFKRIASPMLVHDFRLIPIWFLPPYIIETLKWRALSPPWVQWKNQLSGTAWVRAWGNCVFPNTCFSSVTWVKDNCVSCHFGEIIFNYISVLLA